jgi:hypothetical protein
MSLKLNERVQLNADTFSNFETLGNSEKSTFVVKVDSAGHSNKKGQ